MVAWLMAALILLGPSASAGDDATPTAGPGLDACTAAEEDEEGLRERLTEREDKRRPARPLCTVVAGHPLTVGGEWNAALAGMRPRFVGERVRQPDRLVFESELGILTLGAGISLFRSSSLDLVYHHYRLAEPAFLLRNANLEVIVDGRHQELGHAVDLVLAVEEWERYEFHVALSAFRAGSAFGRDEGTWSFGGFADFAINF